MDTGGRYIEVAQWPKFIDQDGIMHFEKTSRDVEGKAQHLNIRPDVIVFATGYKQSFPFLDSNYPTMATANVRAVYQENDPTVGFIGFVRPSLGMFVNMSMR
jgi:dimethylaniline monooxygenase (N-oxide forming)